MQGDLRRRRRDQNRIFQLEAEQLRGEINARRIHSFTLDEIDPVEGLAVAAKVPLAPVAMRGVVVYRLRDVREHHRLEVECREHLVQARRASVRRVRTRIELCVQQRRTSEYSRKTRQRLSA